MSKLFLHIQAFRNEEEEFDVQEFMLFLNDKDFMNEIWYLKLN